MRTVQRETRKLNDILEISCWLKLKTFEEAGFFDQSQGLALCQIVFYDLLFFELSSKWRT